MTIPAASLRNGQGAGASSYPGVIAAMPFPSAKLSKAEKEIIMADGDSRFIRDYQANTYSEYEFREWESPAGGTLHPVENRNGHHYAISI